MMNLLTKSVLYNITLSILSHLERFGLVQKSRELGFVKNAIEKLNIKVSDVNIPVQQLSGGNQQKVVLAKLTGRSPKILMLFDSTRGVDVGTKSEIFQLLREITKNNASVLLYSTTSDELVNMCDRILVMREGKIQSELTSGNITSENLIRASLGETINSL